VASFEAITALKQKENHYSLYTNILPHSTTQALHRQETAASKQVAKSKTPDV
jgi:hypothetical protein